MRTIVLTLNGIRMGCKISEVRKKNLIIEPISTNTLFRGCARIVVKKTDDNIEFFYRKKIQTT